MRVAIRLAPLPASQMKTSERSERIHASMPCLYGLPKRSGGSRLPDERSEGV